MDRNESVNSPLLLGDSRAPVIHVVKESFKGTRVPVMERNGANDDHTRGDFCLEDSPSYEILNSHNMLTKGYRVTNEANLKMTPPNSTRCHNTMIRLFCCPIQCFFFNGFQVPNGQIKSGYDGRGEYNFFGPGVHKVIDPYFSVSPNTVSVTEPLITNGDRTIVTVDQGCIGYCTERGQPVLLPPGMHQWKSATLRFERLIDLNQPVIELGPWTLLTIDQGYMAVTQDNGQQIILNGGSVYLLTHRNWQFEKFVSTKIQTDDLKRLEAASADNVIMMVNATVLWRIADVETAVLMSAETMQSNKRSNGTDTINKLRNDVLKQAEASLAYFVGTINFSDSMAAAAMSQRSKATVIAVGEEAIPENESSTRKGSAAIEFTLYDKDKLDDAVSHANEITGTYGVEIISINIIGAIPADKKLQESLAAGAVAAAEAQMMETTAKGKSRAIQIEAKAEANQTMILAQADADAEVLRAQGSKASADLLSENPVSVELARIDRTGKALVGEGNHASFFFGSDAKDIKSLLANPQIVK